MRELVLFINNNEQAASITIPEGISVLKDALRQYDLGNAIRRPRIDSLIPTKRQGEWFDMISLEGGIRDPGYYSVRLIPIIASWPKVDGIRRFSMYNTEPGTHGGLVFLFSTENAALLCIMNDGYVQHLKAALLAAIGAEYLARKDSSIVAMIGSGVMARFYAEAISKVRSIRTLKVFSPNKLHVEAFVKEMSGKLGLNVVAADTSEEAVHDSDIVCLCTNSMEPVTKASWLKPGCYIANSKSGELGPDVYRRIDAHGLLVREFPMSASKFTDRDFAIRNYTMSYAAGSRAERKTLPSSKSVDYTYGRKAKYVSCVDWKSGRPYRRKDNEIVILANNSSGAAYRDTGGSAQYQGVTFAALAGRIYENALKKSLGSELPSQMFLQDIPS
jgi:alanine dehydrogenase